MPTVSLDAAGLTALRTESLRRVPLCTRQATSHRPGWRLDLACTQGQGAIVIAEVSPSETWLRGEGILLGWPQEKLAELHAALTAGEAEGNVGPQLG